ncbi:hypothetical protein L665_01382 [Ralstonia solanacearum SD54]|nr:hypothetical protein L665_01382 [Ralstonia solanacearum SD54]
MDQFTLVRWPIAWSRLLAKRMKPVSMNGLAFEPVIAGLAF